MWRPSVGYLFGALAIVAGTLAYWWMSTPTPAPVATASQATSPVAASGSTPATPVPAAAAAGSSAPAAPARAATAASGLPPAATQQVSRTQEPDGDLTPDISVFVNKSEKPTMGEVIERLHQAGVYGGLGAFPPPGSRPPLVGLAVPEGFVLPEGYVRHHQATDDGQRIEPILMYSPDHAFFDAAGRPIAIPQDRVVPPELAPPGLPIRRILIPAPTEPGRPRELNTPAPISRPGTRMVAGILASAVLSFLYARGGAGWLLGFVALVPWLRTLDANRTLGGALLGAYLMSVAFTAAAFAWFGAAIGSYTHLGTATGMALLLLAAPLFQPQFFAFALVRHVTGRRHGRALCALAGASAWVATEWLVPRLLDDTFGYGLYPSALLRQAADLGGAAGLTVLLLLANEGVASALARRAEGVRAVARPLAFAALVPLLLAGYGLAVLSAAPSSTSVAGKPLRIALVQSNTVDYERLRREKGAGAVVRDVLDTHYAMSRDAVERQHADAVLWSETVYPTTFGQPKSEAGAELDREILGIVDAAGVPFVFGTYERDAAGEYNAAAFVAPGTGLLGFYRKTRVFPLTEHVPAWLDGPALRRWLPWAGTWRPGTGARVLPLRLADGREIPVVPLICLDDMDAGLAIDGARLGAQAILTMSNDAWFTERGAALHHAAAAFRSIETRLPQFRVTTNGISAVIDATGSVIAASRMGERTLVVGEVPVGEAPRTLVVAWGDWVGRAGAAFLVLLAATAALRKWRRPGAHAQSAPAVAAGLPAEVAVLPPAARLAAGLLRAFARGSLLWMVAVVLLGDGALQANLLVQMRTFTVLVLAPETAAWCVLLAFAARASIDDGTLVLARGARRLELALRDIAAVEPWHVPIPGPGAALRLVSGEHWRYGLAHPDPAALARALATAGGAPVPASAGSRTSTYAQARAAIRRGRLDQPLAKFVLFPLALAIPAFRLHQHIAYGSSFGEYHSFGLTAYLSSFALWWAAWAIGVVLCAAALRAAIETATLAAVLLRPAQAFAARRWLEGLGLAALYLGLPAWLLLRVFAN